MPLKNVEETYERIIDMSNNNDRTTGNLLDFAYFKNNYKLMLIDLSKQTKKTHNKLILLENLKTKIIEQQCFSLSKNQKKLLLIFHKILSQSVNLLNDSNNKNSKFTTKKWYVIESESKGVYSHKHEIKFLTSSLESSL